MRAFAQIGSLVGAALILGAFAGLQFEKLESNRSPYLLLNLFGAGVLAAAALSQRLWGFVILNTVWALVSLRSLLVSGRTPPSLGDSGS
jgi:hypothetical protein